MNPVILIIVGFFLLIVSLIIAIFREEESIRGILPIIGWLSGITMATGIAAQTQRTTPTALDVYQGKTSLQITYRDTIPIDTIIVFKN